VAAFSEYGSFDAVGLAQLIERREVSASEVAEAAAERIARLNPALNALTASFPEHGAALAAQSPVEGHLCGVPFLLKDLSTHLAGTRLTNGSALYAGGSCRLPG